MESLRVKSQRGIVEKGGRILLAAILALLLSFSAALTTTDSAFGDNGPLPEDESALYLVGYRLWDANWDYKADKEITGTLDPTVMIDPSVENFTGLGSFTWYASLTFNKPVKFTSEEDVLAQLELNGVLSSANKTTTVYVDANDASTIIIRAQDNSDKASAQAFSRTTISPLDESRYVPAITAQDNAEEQAYLTFDIDSISSTGIKFAKVAEVVGTDSEPASVTYKLTSISLIRCANQFRFLVDGEQVGSNIQAHSHSPWTIDPASVIGTIGSSANQAALDALGYVLTTAVPDEGEPTFTITAKEAVAGQTLGWEVNQYPTCSVDDRRIDIADALKTSGASEDVKDKARALLKGASITKAEIDGILAELITLSTLTVGSAPTLLIDARSGEVDTLDLTELALTATGTDGGPFDLTGKEVTWAVASDGGTGATITDGILTVDGSATGRVGITATVDGVTSNTRNVTVGTNSYALSIVVDDGQPVLVSSEDLNGLGSVALRIYSAQSHGGATDSYYSGWGPSLADVIETYAGVPTDRVQGIVFHATDGYNTRFPDVQARLFDTRYRFDTEEDYAEVVPMIATACSQTATDDAEDLDTRQALRLLLGQASWTDHQTGSLSYWIDQMTITLKPTTGIVTTWPAASSIIVGQTIGWGAKLTGGEASVPGEFVFETPDVRPSTGIYKATVLFIPEDTDEYETVKGEVDIEVKPLGPIEVGEDRLAVVSDAVDDELSVAPGSSMVVNVGTNPSTVTVGKGCGHCDGAYDEFSCGEECPDEWGLCTCEGRLTVTPDLSIIKPSDASIATVNLTDGVLTVVGVKAGTTTVELQAQFRGVSQGNSSTGDIISTQALVTAPKVITIVVGEGGPVTAPVITGLSPASGVIAGGTTVVITGSNLEDATEVRFGDVPASSFTVNSASRITAVAPAGVITDTITDKNGESHTAPAQVSDVSVVTAVGTSVDTAADDYLYYTLTVTIGDAVKAYSLADIQAMTAVTGKGGRHGHSDSAGMMHETRSYTGTSLYDLMRDVGEIPVGYSVVVTTADGFRGTFTYDQVKNGDFKFMDVHGNEITEAPGPNAQLLLVYAQEGAPLDLATEGPIRTGVVGDDGQITDGNLWAMWITELSVAPPRQPVITGISPANGSIAGGVVVTITGRDLAYASSVRFGGSDATSYTVVSNTEVTAVAPAGTAGRTDISITTPGGTNVNGEADDFTYEDSDDNQGGEDVVAAVSTEVYKVSTAHGGTVADGTDDQYVLIEIPFDKAISLNDAQALIDSLTMYLYSPANALTSTPAEVVVLPDGKTLRMRLHFGFAAYSGLLHIEPKADAVAGLTTTDADGVVVDFPVVELYVPNGVSLEAGSAVTGTADTPAAVTKTVVTPSSTTRGMVHMLFTSNGSPLGTVNSYGGNFVSHYHNYLTLDAVSFAELVVGSFNGEGIEDYQGFMPSGVEDASTEDGDEGAATDTGGIVEATDVVDVIDTDDAVETGDTGDADGTVETADTGDTGDTGGALSPLAFSSSVFPGYYAVANGDGTITILAIDARAGEVLDLTVVAYPSAGDVEDDFTVGGEQGGEDGKDGQDGKDGVDGKDGKDGQDGKDGVDGKDGKDGKDAGTTNTTNSPANYYYYYSTGSGSTGGTTTDTDDDAADSRVAEATGTPSASTRSVPSAVDDSAATIDAAVTPLASVATESANDANQVLVYVLFALLALALGVGGYLFGVNRTMRRQLEERK